MKIDILEHYISIIEMRDIVGMMWIQKWLRDNFQIDVIAYPHYIKGETEYIGVVLSSNFIKTDIGELTSYRSYDEALEDGLKRAFKYLKENG